MNASESPPNTPPNYLDRRTTTLTWLALALLGISVVTAFSAFGLDLDVEVFSDMLLVAGSLAAFAFLTGIVAVTRVFLSKKTRKGITRASLVALLSTVIGPIFLLLGLLFSFDMTKGRVLRVRGRKTLGPTRRGRGWIEDAIDLDTTSLSDWERAVLGKVWLVSAQMEHASVAAFSKVSLYLTAFGANADLLMRCHQAAADEVKHATRCFALAEAFSGVPHEVGPINELQTTPAATMDLTRFAVGSLIDGYFAEAVAADVARTGAARAIAPAVKDALNLIAADEDRHAKLGLDIVSFCLAQGGEPVRAAVAERLSRLSDEQSASLPNLPIVDDGKLAKWGLIDQDTLAVIVNARLDEVRATVAPLVEPPQRLTA